MAPNRWRAGRRSPATGLLVGLLIGVLGLFAPERGSADELASVPKREPAPTENASAPMRSEVSGPIATDDAEWSTGDSPRSVRLRDGTSIVIGPHSRVLQSAMVPVPLGIKDAASRVVCLDLVEGSLDIAVDENKRPIYGVLIHAPRKVTAIVKTGRASVSASANSTTVAARSGRAVSVSVSERWRTLRVGRSYAVTNESPNGRQQALPTPPSVRIDRPVMLSLGDELPPQRLSWQPVAKARSYWVRLYQLQGESSQIVRKLRVEKPEASLKGLAPGNYRAEVTTVDEDELESPESAPVHLRILAASLPPGAYVTSTAVHLPAQARIALQVSDELEMTYGSGDSPFVPAPETIGLHDGHAVRVRLREKGSKFETRLQLEPLRVEPKILMGPLRAAWPGPPVTVKVDLRCKDGTLPPSEKAISAEVSVNAKPMEVKWNRSEGILRAEIEKPPFPGPWVVRVVVNDPTGQAVARDFLEVAVQPSDAFDLSGLL